MYDCEENVYRILACKSLEKIKEDHGEKKHMKAIQQQFTALIKGTTQFVIPVFQRDYKWSEDQCEQLWKDLIEVAKNPDNNASHFLGSFVYIQAEGSISALAKWLLVDGQQRLTTLTLLMIALRDYIKDTGWFGGEEAPTSELIEDYYLKNSHQKGEREYKLSLRRHDQDALLALLKGEDLDYGVSDRIKENYEYFKMKISEVDPSLVNDGFLRLTIVDVTLDRGIDNPQLIFESLNSTGVDLSQSDLIRNFILMQLDEGEQTRLYEEYWHKIELCFPDAESTFDLFIRDYLALKTKASKQEKSTDVYFAFKKFYQENIGCDTETDAFLEEMLRFAGYYSSFSFGKDLPSHILEPMKRLRKQVVVTGILVMRLYEIQEENDSFSEDEFAEAIRLLESYVLRRSVCDMQSRGYWQIFANIAYRIQVQLPLESLQVALATQSDSYKFPTDEQFRKALENENIYKKRICITLLECLENAGSNEPSPVQTYSIEHIMPQNESLREEWQLMLGAEWKELQRIWLHRLGNLTLTGYNSTYSDRSFEEKKITENGFNDSSVRLNRYVRDQDEWTETQMKERGKLLSARCLKIWEPLLVEEAKVQSEKSRLLKEKASHRDVSLLEMKQPVQSIFESLQKGIQEIDSSIIEYVDSKKSVSYHNPEFILEVLPRNNRLVLLLPLRLTEIDDPSGIAKDARSQKFFANSKYGGEVFLGIRNTEEVAFALPIIRQAMFAVGAS